MPVTPIRMIWWDYGRVLFNHLSDELMEGLAQISSSGELPFEICRKVYASGVVARYDLGIINTEEFLASMRSIIGFRDPKEFVALWHRILQPNRLAWNAVTRLRMQGYLQGVISNINALQADYIEKVLATGSIMQFRPRIYSYQEKIGKPDRAIFRRALKRANKILDLDAALLPEECVFIDDMHENVNAARSCGWHAIHHNPGYVHSTLAKLLELEVRL